MSKFRLVYTLTSLIVFSLILIFVSYAFLESQATNSSISGNVFEAQVKFNGSDDVNIENIGPVLDYRDGVLVEFSIDNSAVIYSTGTFDVKLDIESVSSNKLLVEDFKYILLKSSNGIKYTEIAAGDFKNFSVGGSNLILGDTSLENGISYYRIYFYIDGTKNNNIDLMTNEIVGKVLVDMYVTGSQKLLQLVSGSTFNSYIDDTTTAVVFTDEVAPEGVTTTDVSKDGDGSVVAWVEETTMYVSTQVSGMTIAAISCDGMFSGKSNLVSIDLTMLDTSAVTSMYQMFQGCSGLTSLNLSNLDTSKVTTMERMFQQCMGLTSLDLSSFDTSSVTNMYQMFFFCSGLTSLNLSGFDTSSVTDMYHMFADCRSLVSLDVSGFDTSSVTSMTSMFRSCTSLTSLDLSSFETSSVTSMYQMFAYCSELTSLDVSGFDTSSVTVMTQMFFCCSKLTLDCSSWNVDKVTEYTSFNYNASGVTAPTWVN